MTSIQFLRQRARRSLNSPKSANYRFFRRLNRRYVRSPSKYRLAKRRSFAADTQIANYMRIVAYDAHVRNLQACVGHAHTSLVSTHTATPRVVPDTGTNMVRDRPGVHARRKTRTGRCESCICRCTRAYVSAISYVASRYAGNVNRGVGATRFISCANKNSREIRGETRPARAFRDSRRNAFHGE